MGAIFSEPQESDSYNESDDSIGTAIDYGDIGEEEGTPVDYGSVPESHTEASNALASSKMHIYEDIQIEDGPMLNIQSVNSRYNYAEVAHLQGMEKNETDENADTLVEFETANWFYPATEKGLYKSILTGRLPKNTVQAEERAKTELQKRNRAGFSTIRHDDCRDECVLDPRCHGYESMYAGRGDRDQGIGACNLYDENLELLAPDMTNRCNEANPDYRTSTSTTCRMLAYPKEPFPKKTPSEVVVRKCRYRNEHGKIDTERCPFKEAEMLRIAFTNPYSLNVPRFIETEIAKKKETESGSEM